MDFINTILAFAVLSGPLWLIALAFLASVVAAVLLAKRLTSLGGRIVAGAAVFLFAFLALFGDEIVGRMYFEHLCQTEAGIKIYQTVELPAEYWDEEGKAQFIVYEGANNKTMFLIGENKFEDSRFESSMFFEPYSSILHIDKTGFRLRERKTEQTLGEVLYFRYWHGWLARNFSVDRSAISCESKKLDDWKYGIFTPIMNQE